MTTPWDKLSLKEKVHRVSELEGELSMLKAGYADCNRERARWKTIADNQRNTLETLAQMLAPCSRTLDHFIRDTGLACDIARAALAAIAAKGG